jgi:hypothetical protein
VPEETGGPGNQREIAAERLEARLDRLEQEVLMENRWWRGGLIGALVLVALAILIGGHHRHRPPERMAMAGWAGPAAGPYGGYGPYPPPPGPGFGWGGPCGRDGFGPRTWGGPPREWGAPGAQVPQDQPQPNR